MLNLQPLQNQGSISGVTEAPDSAPLNVADSNSPTLGYVTDNPNQQGQVAPLDDTTKSKMVSLLSAAQQKYPGQEEQILNQFIADNQDKYPAQMGKIQSFLTTPDTSRTARNNNPTAMTTDVAESLGLQDGVDYTQGDPFKTSDGQTLYTAKLSGSDPISATVSAFDKAASDNTPIFTTASGKPRWSYINMSNQQWEDLSPQDKVATVKHMQTMENGPGGSATKPSGFSPKSVLQGLISDNQPTTPTPQTQSPQDRSGNFFQRLGQDIGNRYQTLVGENQEVNQGKMGPVGFGFDLAGQLAGTTGDVIGEGLTSAFRTEAPQISQQGLQMIGNSPIVQGTENTIGNLVSNFQKAHPVGAGHLAAAGNIAALGLSFLGGENALTDASDADTWEKIKPNLTSTEQAQAVKSGAIQSKGLLGTITQVPTDSDQAMIEAAKPYVANTKNPIQAVSNMQQGISDEATSIRQALKDSPASWNINELKGQINDIKLPNSIKSDQTLLNNFNNAKSDILELASTASKKPDGLLDVRQSFDKIMQDDFGSRIWNRTDGVSKVYKSFRNILNDMADSKIPDNQGLVKASLKKQSLLYDAIDNVASKVPKLGTNTSVLGSALKFGSNAVKTGLRFTPAAEIAKHLP